MGIVNQVRSSFSSSSQGVGNQGTACSRFTRVATGIGAAGLAVVSWKFIAAGALAYSAYRGGRYLRDRFFQSVQEEIAPHASEQAVAMPIDGGHDAHGDQQERPHEMPQVEIEDEELLFEQFVAEIRQRQANATQKATKNVLEILITHPKLREKFRDLAWIQKIIEKHGAWSNRTFGLSSYLTKAYRTVQACK